MVARGVNAPVTADSPRHIGWGSRVTNGVATAKIWACVPLHTLKNMQTPTNHFWN